MMLFSRNQWITLIGCAITAISLFLPLGTVSFLSFSQSITYFEGDGKFVLVFIIIIVILIIRDTKVLLQLILSVLSAVFLGWALFSVSDGLAELGEYSNMFHYSVGLYVMIIGIIIMITGTILQKREW